jgi:hypothetical protein
MNSLAEFVAERLGEVALVGVFAISAKIARIACFITAWSNHLAYKLMLKRREKIGTIAIAAFAIVDRVALRGARGRHAHRQKRVLGSRKHLGDVFVVAELTATCYFSFLATGRRYFYFFKGRMRADRRTFLKKQDCQKRRADNEREQKRKYNGYQNSF